MKYLTGLTRGPSSSLPLSDLRNRYIQGRLVRKDFEGRIFQVILDDYQQFTLFKSDKDAFIDYLCWFYPRLSRAIDAYNDVGSSFDAYMYSQVRLCSKEYYSREAKHRVIERACWEARAEEAAAIEYALEETEDSFKPVKNPQQALILMLKLYYLIFEDFVACAGPAIGMSVRKLNSLLDKIRELRSKSDDQIYQQQKLMDSQYCRYVIYRKQLERVPENSVLHEILLERMEKAWLRCAQIKNQLAGVKRSASNQQIAEVLGISKGTVDAAMYAIKQKAKQGKHEPEE
jgi:DNA-directed RNA polymerase specialized sigma24 family protein